MVSGWADVVVQRASALIERLQRLLPEFHAQAMALFLLLVSALFFCLFGRHTNHVVGRLGRRDNLLHIQEQLCTSLIRRNLEALAGNAELAEPQHCARYLLAVVGGHQHQSLASHAIELHGVQIIHFEKFDQPVLGLSRRFICLLCLLVQIALIDIHHLWFAKAGTVAGVL